MRGKGRGITTAKNESSTLCNKGKGKSTRKGKGVDEKKSKICDHAPSEPVLNHQIDNHTTPLRGNSAVEISNRNKFSTPQAYPSGVIYCGTGGFDWALSSPTQPTELQGFIQLLKRHPPTIASPLPEASSCSSQFSELFRSSSTSSLSSSYSSSTLEEFGMYHERNKRRRRDSSIGLLDSPIDALCSPRSISPPPFPPLHKHNLLFNHENRSLGEPPDRYSRSFDRANRCNSSRVAMTMELMEETEHSSLSMASSSFSSPFFDILNESPPSESSSPPHCHRQLLRDVAQYLYPSFA
jgi:hypothetical protein